MPGLLKIGYTTTAVEARIAELSNATGVPTKFAVEAFFEVEDPARLEKRIHQSLQKHRIRKQREFFRVSPEEAKQIICQLVDKPPTLHTRIAPRRSPNYRDQRWLTPEEREFIAIKKDLWNVQKDKFQNTFLTNPNVPTPPKTFAERFKSFFIYSEHDLRGLTYDKDRLNACFRVARELGGSLMARYGTSYILCAAAYSIVSIRISSAVDMQPDRIRAILVRLQEAERQVHTSAKHIYETRHQS